jgi:hypothetical protein
MSGLTFGGGGVITVEKGSAEDGGRFCGHFEQLGLERGVLLLAIIQYIIYNHP